MADDVDIRVRVRGAQKAAAEMHQVAAAEDEIGDNARKANREMGKLHGPAADVTQVLGDVEQAAKAAAGGIGGGGPGGAGGGASGVTGSFGGLIGISATLSVALVALAVTIAGVLVVGFAALAASAIAAAAALGTLAIAGGGVFAVAFGIASVAAAKFKQDMDRVGTAAYRLNRAFGRTFDVVIKSFGPGIDWIFTGLARSLKALRPLIMALGPVVFVLGHAFAQALEIITAGIIELKPEFLTFLNGITPLLAALAPAVVPFVGIMVDIANAALPFLIVLAQMLAQWVIGFRRVTAGGQVLRPIIFAIFMHLAAWLNLAWQLSRVFIGLLRAAAPFGKDLVVWLGAIVRHFADWVNSRAGQERLKEFFAHIIPAVKSILIVVGQLAIVFIRWLEVAAPILKVIFDGINLLIQALFLTQQALTAGVVGAFNAVGQAFSAVYNFIAPKIQWLLDRINDLIAIIPHVGIDIPGLGHIGLGPGGEVGKPGAGTAGTPDIGGFGQGFGNDLFGFAPTFPKTMGASLPNKSKPISIGQAIGDLVVPVTVVTANDEVLARGTARAARRHSNRK